MIRRSAPYHVGDNPINRRAKKPAMESVFRKAAELLLDFMNTPVIEVGNSLDIRITQLAKRHGIRAGQIIYMNIVSDKELKELLDSGMLDGKRMILAIISEEVEK